MPYARENRMAENRLLCTWSELLFLSVPGRLPSPLGPFFLLPKRAERIRQTSMAQA